MRLLVTVFYREPTFEARIRRRGAPYQWTLEIEASDASAAISMARRGFDAVAAESGAVGFGTSWGGRWLPDRRTCRLHQ